MMFCTSDIQLEKHCCLLMEDVKRAELEALEKSLTKVVAEKVVKF
jgi:hypothetical protein